MSDQITTSGKAQDVTVSLNGTTLWTEGLDYGELAEGLMSWCMSCVVYDELLYVVYDELLYVVYDELFYVVSCIIRVRESRRCCKMYIEAERDCKGFKVRSAQESSKYGWVQQLGQFCRGENSANHCPFQGQCFVALLLRSIENEVQTMPSQWHHPSSFVSISL